MCSSCTSISSSRSVGVWDGRALALMRTTGCGVVETSRGVRAGSSMVCLFYSSGLASHNSLTYKRFVVVSPQHKSTACASPFSLRFRVDSRPSFEVSRSVPFPNAGKSKFMADFEKKLGTRVRKLSGMSVLLHAESSPSVRNGSCSLRRLAKLTHVCSCRYLKLR